MKYTKTYLMKTPAGYKRVRRRIGKRNAKKTTHSLVAPILFSISVGLSLGVGIGARTIPSVIEAETVVISTPVEEGVSDEPQIEVAGQTAPSNTTESEMIEQAVDEFLFNSKSESLMIMHCLANRESHHGDSGKPTDPHGDNGLAGGPFQFHQATWDRMRGQMGETDGTRYDFQEAARTTAWAIANGRALEWGPILRAANGSNYAACPVPSWYR